METKICPYCGCTMYLIKCATGNYWRCEGCGEVECES